MNNKALPHCIHALYCEPWLITPAMHRMLCTILADHISGAAHGSAGRADMFMNPAKDPDEDEDEEGAISADGVRTIAIEGIIGRRVSGIMKSSGVQDVLDITKRAESFTDDANVKGVLLDIDSPGGTVTGVPEAAYAIRMLRAKKPVVTYTGGLAASAAYWLGSQATAIYASPSAQVGSIGVYQFLLDSSRQAEMNGVKPMLFASGKFKGMGIDGLPLTDAQAERIRDTVDILFGWFRRDVLNARKIADDDMQGQTFYAADALAHNLIDRVGTRDEALAELRGMLK